MAQQLLWKCQSQAYSSICAIWIGCIYAVVFAQKGVAKHHEVLAGPSQNARDAQHWIVLWDLCEA